MHAKDLQPNTLQQAHEMAWKKACTELSLRDPETIAANCGAQYNRDAGVFTIRYLNEDCNVTFPSGEVTYADKNDAVPVTVKVVLLHYLLKAGEQPLQEQWISFKEIPHGGMIYLEPFTNRVVKYLLAIFGKQPQLLLEAGKMLGGKQAAFGNYSICLPILPNFPVQYVLWTGDDEFPAQATVLFDVTAPQYLPTEDIVVASAYGVSQLVKAAKKLTAPT